MAKIADLLAAGPTRSFEFFPPKTLEMAVQLDEAVADLAGLGPSYISVTYGALGTTRAPTRDVVIRFNQDHGFPAMPHLTCVGQSKAELRELLEQYRDAGIENVLALAGDPPADGSEVDGDFTYARELIELVRDVGDFSIGVAAFPELHPRSSDRITDRKYLAEKLGEADFAITQFFFDAAEYRQLCDEMAELGSTTPIIPGVMPFVSVAGTRRMSATNGVRIPDALQSRLDEVDGDAEATRRLGVAVASELSAALLEGGVPGLHLYAMNRPTSIREVYANLGWAGSGS